MRIIIVNIYFGKCPRGFDMFLKSCAMNPAIDFLFFVDFVIPHNFPSNVRFVKTTFDEIRTRFQGEFDFPITLNSAYKLCDFRPAYGDIFTDYFAAYDWWGHCDFDMMFGDLTPVVQVVRKLIYVKIFRRGHLSLYRNSADINSIYRNEIDGLNYRDIFSSEKFCLFDETNGIDRIFTALQLPVFREELIADISPKSAFLNMTVHPNRWGQYFVWTQGKLQCKSLTGIDREFLYIHFQKRQMGGDVINGTGRSDILINNYGFFDSAIGVKGWILRVLSLIPNLAHLKRFYLPRIVKVVKRKVLGRQGRSD